MFHKTKAAKILGIDSELKSWLNAYSLSCWLKKSLLRSLQ